MERSCQAQLLAEAAGTPVLIDPDMARKTYRQVAEVLGIPEGTAKSRLRLGLRRIADVLETETVARSE